MDPIERKLAEQKNKVDQLSLPPKLDDRLEKVLYSSPTRKPKHFNAFIKVVVAAVFILVCLAGYNHNALAYYSKKILGFDNLYGTLGQLNEDEMGQVIEKTVKLEDGLYFTINGIMTDANQLVMFYTFSAPEGIDEFEIWQYSISSISGFMTNAGAHGGSSYENEGGTEIKGIFNFDPVNPLAKKLTLHIWEEDGMQEITFPHDPNKAMKASIDTPIDKTVQLDRGSITFDSITASPTMTLLKGSIDIEAFDHFPSDALTGIKLLGNELTVGRDRSSTRTEEIKTTFEISYHALPDELDNLKIFVKKFIGYKKINNQINLSELSEEGYDLHGENIVVKDITQKSGKVYITVATEEVVMLDGLKMEIDENMIYADDINFTEEMYYENKGIQMIERTYEFRSEEIPSTLYVEGMYYLKPYHNEINIPIK